MTPSSASAVAVSYAWKEEKSGPHTGVVQEFCDALKSAGVAVRRDLESLKPGDDIRSFMRSIGAADFLCVFLSDAYLRSKNCMYELLVAWQHSRDDAAGFRQRVKFWVMPGTDGIYDVTGRVTWLEHWKAEHKKVEPLLKKHVGSGLSSESIGEISRIGEIAQNIESILAFVANTLSPASAEDYRAWIAAQFPKATAGPSEDELARVFENTALGIEDILNDSPVVRDFLRSNTHSLFIQQSARWQLDPAVRRREFDVCPHLRRVRDGLSKFTGATRSALDDLERVLGGLVVMAIDPVWVLQQRALMKAGENHYPGRDDAVPIGSGSRANFLHLVASALADGHARVHKLFGDPPGVGDERCVPEPAMVSGAVLEEEQQTALKIHFIRYILGPDVAVDPTKPADVELRFKQVRDIVAYALTEDREPYWASGPAFRKLSGTIRQNLELSDMLLIFPSGCESEDSILAQSMFVLKHLHQIFTTIKSRRASLPA